MTENNKSDKKETPLPKKAYQAPKLTDHGLVTEVTTGGTGNAQESSSGQRPRM